MKKTMNLHVALLAFLLLFFVPVGPAQAISTASGNLALTLGIDYDVDKLQWRYINGTSSLEVWTLSQILSNEAPYILADDMRSIYDYDGTPGWNVVPDPLSVAAFGSSSTIENYTDRSEFSPGGVSNVEAVAGVLREDVQAYSNMIYFATFEALASGSFTFYVDYNGSWQGTTAGAGDIANLHASLSAGVNKLVVENDRLSDWGEVVSSFHVFESPYFSNGDDGDINDFAGRASLTVDYEQGDFFYLRFDGVNSVWVKSELSTPPPPPVPEPGTFVLLALGLLGCVAIIRRQGRTRED